MNTFSRARRILFLTPSLAPGGLETMVVQLAKAIRADGSEVGVVSMLPPTEFVEELERAGVAVISLKMRSGRLNIAEIVRFFLYVRRFQPDIMHSHMFHASILGRMVHLFTGIPVVCTVHSEIECSHRKTSAKFREWIYRLTDSACARTTAVSVRVRDRYVREKIVPANRIEVIDNGVDTEIFQPRVEQREETRAAMGWQNSFTWLAVGRLEIAKDYPSLIRAFREVLKRSSQARLVIVGEGRCRLEIEQLVELNGLSPAVSLLGLRSDIPDLMNACDALVMSSAWEGGPLVVLEAGACGRPMVATEVGVAREAVLPAETGYLVPPRDPQALAQAMIQLMRLDAEVLRQMGARARRHVIDRFSLGTTHKNYRTLYEEVLTVC